MIQGSGELSAQASDHAPNLACDNECYDARTDPVFSVFCPELRIDRGDSSHPVVAPSMECAQVPTGRGMGGLIGASPSARGDERRRRPEGRPTCLVLAGRDSARQRVVISPRTQPLLGHERNTEPDTTRFVPRSHALRAWANALPSDTCVSIPPAGRVSKGLAIRAPSAWRGPGDRSPGCRPPCEAFSLPWSGCPARRP